MDIVSSEDNYKSIRMNLKTSIVSIALILFCVFKANAQTNRAYSPSHLQAAEAFLKSTGVDKQFDNITNILASTLSTQMPADKRASLAEVMKKFMAKYFNWDIMKNDLSKVYASELSESDLKAATAFYNSPAGKRMSQKLPQLMEKGLLMGQKIIQDHKAEMQQMIQEANKKP